MAYGATENAKKVTGDTLSKQEGVFFLDENCLVSKFGKTVELKLKM